MKYGVRSRDYLARARQRLDDSTSESLFYAAFELRAGIEARMREYLEAQTHISQKMKKGWRIAQLANNLEKVFRTGDKVVEFAVHSRGTRAPLCTFYYTPVNRKLKKMGEQLGNYLHSMKQHRPPQDDWWLTTRGFFEEAFVELQKATAGTLLGVPLINRDTGVLNMSIEVPEGGTRESLLQTVGGVGAQVDVKVSYLDEVPKEALRRA